MKLEKFFELINPKYCYIHIIPHKAVKNHNSINICKAIALSFKSINKRIKKEQKKLFFETNFKISYCIDIKGKEPNFYFIVPVPFKMVIMEKLKEIWGKCTIEEVNQLESFSDSSMTYQLSYKKEDALSLEVDKRTSVLLSNNLTVIEIMENTDRLTILYNFIPRSQFGWNDRYDKIIKKYHNNEPLERDKKSATYIAKTMLNLLSNTLETIINTIGDLFGDRKTTYKNNISLAESLATLIEGQRRELTKESKLKRDSLIINTQILVTSSSKDETRKFNNLNTVCQAYKTIDSDNELIYKKAENPKSLEKYMYKADINTCSVDECCNFVQLPTKETLRNLNIKHIKVEENLINEKLLKGYKRLGTATLKGKKLETYIEDDYNIGNLPLVLIGSQGSGKTTFLSNYAADSTKVKESCIVLDFIKNCELSEDIEKVIDKKDLIIIDLSKEEDLQGFGYNEIKLTDDMTCFKICELANEQAQQVISLVNAIGTGEELTQKMRVYLNAAATIVFAIKKNSIKDVVTCLTNHQKREEYINLLPKLLKEQLAEEVETLKALDDIKITKEGEEIITGTKYSKIEGILDRISLLRENFKLKYMYNKSLDDNIDFVKAMEEGKTILIKMRQSEYSSEIVKNILITYWISKIWLACQLRGALNLKPLRTNIIVDEVFQAPTTMGILKYIIPQSRKFGCKFVFSTQNIDQLDKINSTLESCGASYMLLNGCLEKDFRHFENKLEGFEYEDFRDMKKTYLYPSMNLIYSSEGYQSFITKLPKPL